MPPVDRNNPKRGKGSESSYSLMEFTREFPDDATCLEWLWRERLSADGKTAECPKCGRSRSFHRVKARPSYSCDSCGHHLHPTAGTIFHKSSTSLHLWFYAIFLMSQTRCAISAKQLERELGVTYKTAWRMFNRIRNQLMNDEDLDGPLHTEVEFDEMWVGGKPRLSTRRKRGTPTPESGLVPVLGIVQRRGKVVARVVPDTKMATLMPIVRAFVFPSSLIYTDDRTAYAGALGKAGYRRHRRVRHSAKIYVMGDTHTQTIEGFFGLTKNAIRGVYHGVSYKWLQSYLNEFAWRYNHRDDSTPMFRTLLSRAALGD